MMRALPAGIDSINFRDIIGGTGGVLFNETITSGPDSVTIPNENLTKIALIVYYDMNDLASAVREPLVEHAQPSLRLVPNPAVASVAIETPMPAGTRLVMNDLRGATFIDERVAEATDRRTLTLESMPGGHYLLRAIGPDGALLAESRLVVER
jgi:hypothetical protein